MAFGHVVIRRTKNGNAVRVKAQGALIVALGWGALDDGTGSFPKPPSGRGYTATRALGPVRASRGGTPMRISFHPSKNGTQPGGAFRFRINKSATNADLIRLAAATQGAWCWMTDLNGHRIDREEWLAWAQGTRLHRAS